jgi:hypothetical protein
MLFRSSNFNLIKKAFVSLHPMKYLAIILMASLLSCTDNYTLCTESKLVQLSSFFYKKVGGQEVISNAPSLTIKDLGTNQTIFSNLVNVPSFSIVLNPTLDSMKFFISLSPTLQADTLTVVYTTGSKPLTPECGTITTHKILSAKTTKHTLDTVKLTNDTVDNGLAPNTKIIFQ